MGGGRWNALKKLCAENNWDIWSTKGQCEHLFAELTNPNFGENGWVKESKIWNNPNSTIESLTVEFRKEHERPNESEANDSRRIEGANDAYNAYCK